MQTVSGKILTAVISLFLLLYVGYQVYRHFTSDMQTQTVFAYTVQDTEKVSGLLVRNEVALDQAMDGVVSYYFDDGVKVSVGTTIADVYPSKEDVLGRRRIRELDTELARLVEIESLGSNYFLNSESISKQLSESLYAVIKSNETGILTDIPQQKSILLANLNKKQLATGVVTDFSAKTARLMEEKQKIEASLSGTVQSVTADSVGYFSSFSDQLESRITPEALETMGVEELEEYMNGQWEQDESKLGKMIRQEPWRLALVKDLEDAAMLYKGLRVDVDFGIPQYQSVPAIVESTREDKVAGKQIAVLSCNYICPELTRLRNPTVELHYQVYSGLKIPNQAVRFRNKEKGVYVSAGDAIQFKKIQVVYEGNGYVLSREDKIDETAVKLYDEVIVSGKIPEDAVEQQETGAMQHGDGAKEQADT